MALSVGSSAFAARFMRRASCSVASTDATSSGAWEARFWNIEFTERSRGAERFAERDVLELCTAELPEGLWKRGVVEQVRR